MTNKLPRKARSENDKLLLLLENGLPSPLGRMWHRSPDHFEALLGQGGFDLPHRFMSNALLSNKNNIRGWGHNRYQGKHWYCFDMENRLDDTQYLSKSNTGQEEYNY